MDNHYKTKVIECSIVFDREYKGYCINDIYYLCIKNLFPNDEEKAWKCIEKIDNKFIKFINPNDLLLYDTKPISIDTELLVSWEGLLERLTYIDYETLIESANSLEKVKELEEQLSLK